MKPTKNKVFCPDIGRTKMLFETEKKAQTFIKFNSPDIGNESGKKPERSYFCVSCAGYHITSEKSYSYSKSKTEIVLDEYTKIVEVKKLSQEEKAISYKNNQLELKKSLATIGVSIAQLEKMETTSDAYAELIKIVVAELDKAKNLKKFQFKGSDKRLEKAEEKMKKIAEAPML